MNIQYQDLEQSSLLGSYRQKHAPEYYTVPKQQNKQIIHKVVYGDTLEGLSLTYDVPISKIRQRNKIQSDEIYYLKEIVIPDPQCTPTPKQQELEYMKIQQFLLYMVQNQKSMKTARYYLSENDWDVAKAVQEYREDLEWEKKNRIKSNLVTTTFTKMQDNRRERTQIQMMVKKKQ